MANTETKARVRGSKTKTGAVDIVGTGPVDTVTEDLTSTEDLNNKEARAAAKAAREEAAAKRKQEAEAKKAERERVKAEKEAAKAAKKEEADKKKAEAKAAREANRRPQQNGVRRPKPETLCGQVWGLADSLSETLGQPVPVGELIISAKAQGLNVSNVRAEYASWKKYHGLSGRITLPKPEAVQQAGA